MALAAHVVSTVVEAEPTAKTRLIPPWNLILLDDNEHTFDYVVEMLAAIFGFNPVRAAQHTIEVDATGRTILITTSREHAELKQEQVHAYGPDRRLPKVSTGSMRCTIEPAS